MTRIILGKMVGIRVTLLDMHCRSDEYLAEEIEREG